MKDNADKLGLNLPEFIQSTPGEDSQNKYQLEDAIVQNVSCNPEHPLCLYDFTINNIMTDFIAYAVPNLFN